MEFNHETDMISSTVSWKRKCGRKKFRETRHPVYRGVRGRNGDKWVCEIREPKKKSRIWLGTYPTAEMAAIAHDVASLALKGSMGALNFPNLVSLIPRPRSCSPNDIRVAARQAAESLIRPKPSNSSSSDIVVAEAEVAVGEATASFWDDEELFNLPGVVESMAEGLLLTPPALRRGFSFDDFDLISGQRLDHDYFSLWTD